MLNLPKTVATRIFLLFSALEAIVDITIEALILREGEFFSSLFDTKHNATSSPTESLPDQQVLPVYLSIFAIAHVFQCALAIDAIHNRNTIQIIGLCLFNLCFLAYAVMAISEVKAVFEEIGKLTPKIDACVLIVPVMIGASQLVYMVTSWFIYREFGWDVFKALGADRRIKKMYLAYQVYICICKFDIFFVFAFSVQFVVLVLKQNDVERWLTVAAAPITIAILAAGFISAKREIKWLMVVFITGCALGEAYFGFKIFRIFQNTDDRYGQVRKSLTTFSCISLVALLATIGQSLIVYRNFGKGLKFHMSLKSLGRKPTFKANDSGFLDGDDDQGLHYKLESANSSRMSID